MDLQISRNMLYNNLSCNIVYDGILHIYVTDDATGICHLKISYATVLFFRIVIKVLKVFLLY